MELYTALNEGKLYPCAHCEHASTNPSDLKKHIESKHQEFKFTCDLCDYAASRPKYLKQHIESKHEGIKYYCNQCEYSATAFASLKKHKEIKHGDKIISDNSSMYTFPFTSD